MPSVLEQWVGSALRICLYSRIAVSRFSPWFEEPQRYSRHLLQVPNMFSGGADGVHLTNVLFEAQEHDLVELRNQNRVLPIPPTLQETE